MCVCFCACARVFMSCGNLFTDLLWTLSSIIYKLGVSLTCLGPWTSVSCSPCVQVVARPLQLEERMAVLAAAISIDYDYFS